jgi:hypothetical protein
MEPAVQAALVAGAISFATALTSLVVTLVFQRRTADRIQRNELEARTAKAETDEAMARLGAQLERERDEEAALRDYRYDALRHLYADVNPVMFRLREECAGSVRRVRRILRGDIRVDTDRHLLTSAQRLVAPLVLAHELQRHLTSVDLRLDAALRAQYIVARELLWNLHEGTYIAEVTPEIPYRPLGNERKEPRQHLTYAQLQRLVNVLTEHDADGARRPLGLTELEDRAGDPDVAAGLARLRHLFAGASASTAPVLWRLLLAQSALMHILIDLVDRGDGTVLAVLPPGVREYDWTDRDPGRSFDAEVDAVDRYLREKLAKAGLPVRTS